MKGQCPRPLDGRVDEGIWKDDVFQYTTTLPKAKTPDYSICAAGQWCSDKFVCSQGTLTVNGKSIWNETPKWNKYVVEAKNRGLSCGVLPPSISASKTQPPSESQTISVINQTHSAVNLLNGYGVE